MLATMITETLPKKPTSPPLFTFVGPDTDHQVSAINATGNQVASFTVSGNQGDFTISRNGSSTFIKPLCKCHKSSLTGSKTMTIHNQDATLRGEDTRFEVRTAKGPLKWRITSDGMGGTVWVDKNKNTAAIGSSKEGQLKVYVNADEFVLDCLLAGWMSLVLKPSPGEEDLTEGVLLGLKVLTYAMGGVGGVGGN